MAMLGCEDRQEENNGTYLDIAGFLMQHGAKPDEDLPELWRRIVFSLLVSNTDDHLRNHGFILTRNGWRLSPLYDVNPVPYGNELSLNVDNDSNEISFDLAISVAKYFGIDKTSAEKTAQNIIAIVQNNWEVLAGKCGIDRNGINLMRPAFFLK